MRPLALTLGPSSITIMSCDRRKWNERNRLIHRNFQDDEAMAYATTVERHKTREVGVGDHIVGGDNPIWVQSMTTTNTFDVEATLAQIHRLEEAGCEIVRVTVPKKEDVEAAKLIRDRIKIPLIADIHYDYRMALACLDAVTPSGRPAVDKIRINPGNIGGEERFKEVVRKARDKGIPMRIGVNSGSLEKDLIDKYGFPCPEAMVESALRYIEMAERLGYHADDRQPEGQPRADGRRVLHPVRRAERLSRPTSASPRRARASTARSRAPPASARSCSAASATRSASRCWATRSPRSRPASTSCAPATAA